MTNPIDAFQHDSIASCFNMPQWMSLAYLIAMTNVHFMIVLEKLGRVVPKPTKQVIRVMECNGTYSVNDKHIGSLALCI